MAITFFIREGKLSRKIFMGSYHKRIVAGCFFVLFFAFFSTRSEAGDDLPNILLITVDACRPDHFGSYGYARNTTPNIDKLVKKGVVFTHAFSQSAWTTPSMISIFTSRYPPSHNVDARGKTLEEDVVTLPEVLKKNGYSVPVLPKFIDIPNYWHLGFDAVDKEQFQGEEGEDLLKLLEACKDRRFFLWYHYHGLHLPYNPQNPYDTLFMDDDAISGTSTVSEAIMTVKSRSVIKNGSVHFDDKDKKAVVALYDGQLRQLDDYIGRLMEKIGEWGFLDNTIIIVTSDHGEELFEHGFIGHASTSLNAKLYDEIIHIPMIVWYPQKLKQKVIDEPVQQIDIMPTLLDMLGLPIPAGLQGCSLLPLMCGRSVGGSRPVFCETILGGYQSTKEMEGIKLRCVRTKEWKLIYTNIFPYGLSRECPGSGKFELYDLRADPTEGNNVIENHPDIASGLKKKLLQWVKTTTPEECVSPQ